MKRNGKTKSRHPWQKQTRRLSLKHQHRWARLSQKAIFASSRSAWGTKDFNGGEKMNVSSLAAVQVLFFVFRVVVLYAGSLVFRCFSPVERDLLVLSARTHSRLRWRNREVSQMSLNMLALVLKSRSLYSVVVLSSPRNRWPVNRNLNWFLPRTVPFMCSSMLESKKKLENKLW